MNTIENLIINVGTDPDLTDFVVKKVGRKGFKFSNSEIEDIKRSQSKGEDQYLRIRFDRNLLDSRHTGHGVRGTYTGVHGIFPAWGFEACISVSPIELEGILNKRQKQDTDSRIVIHKEYTAIIAPDRKTVKVGCTTFEAEKILMVADALRAE